MLHISDRVVVKITATVFMLVCVVFLTYVYSILKQTYNSTELANPLYWRGLL